MHTSRNLLFACLVIGMSAGVAQAEVFKWRDTSGKVHYSDRPPPEQPSAEVSAEIAPPPCDAPCQQNAAEHQKYIESYMARKKAEEARFLSGRNASVEETRRAQAQRDSQARQAAQDAHQRSERERQRVPSRSVRRP
jgi:hypothetical protein